MASKQANEGYEEAFGGTPESHDNLVAPFENIREEDFFEQEDDSSTESDDNREYIPMPTIFEPIPEEAQKEILSNFALKKREKESTIAISAQRLVNQFRALSAFRDDYVVTYNKDLMQAPGEVLAYLPNIIGGPAVREYLDYLTAQQKTGKKFDDKDIDLETPQQTGWLPSADEEETVFPFASSTAQTDKQPLPVASNNKQTDMFIKSLQELTNVSKRQSELLTDTLTLLNQTIQKNGESSASLPANAGQSLTEAATLLAEQRQMMEQTVDKMMEMQNQLFTQTVAELSKNVSEMKDQLRPAGTVRQALSALKASSTGQKEPPAPKEKVKDTQEQPLFDRLEQKEATPKTTPLSPSKPPKQAKKQSKKTTPTIGLDDGEYEILTEFDIQQDTE